MILHVHMWSLRNCAWREGKLTMLVPRPAFAATEAKAEEAEAEAKAEAKAAEVKADTPCAAAASI